MRSCLVNWMAADTCLERNSTSDPQIRIFPKPHLFALRGRSCRGTPPTSSWPEIHVTPAPRFCSTATMFAALGHIRDEERGYLLRVEFGVDAALPLVVPTRQLSDVVVPTPGGMLLLTPHPGKQHIIDNLVQRLKNVGFRSSPAGNTIGAPLPDRIILIKASIHSLIASR